MCECVCEREKDGEEMAVVCEVSRVRFLSIFYSGAACGDAKKYESKLFW